MQLARRRLTLSCDPSQPPPELSAYQKASLLRKLSFLLTTQALLLSPPLLPVASSPVLVAPTPCSNLALAPLEPDVLSLVPLASFADELPVAPVCTGRAEALVLSELDGVAEERVLAGAVGWKRVSGAQVTVALDHTFSTLTACR